MTTLTTLSLLLIGQGGFMSLPPEHQLFNSEVSAWAESNTQKFAAAWPVSGHCVVSHTLVPQAVWAGYAEWTARLLKSDWLPQDLRNRTIAIRGHHGNDVLAARYGRNGYEVQIMEMAGNVGLVVKDVAGAGVSMPATETVLTDHIKVVMARFLNMSSEEVGRVQVAFRPREIGTSHIATFGIGSNVGYEFVPKWWMITSGFTDGRSVFFSIPKATGERTEFGGATPSQTDTRVRFLPGG